MAIDTVVSDSFGKVWIDITDPTHDELIAIANKFDLHPSSVEDCLDPTHLPKGEKIGHTWFFILRLFDEHSGPHADTVQELTRKIALFIGPSFLISIHRTELSFLTESKRLYAPENSSILKATLDIQQVFFELVSRALNTYHAPLEKGMALLSHMETQVFLQQNPEAEFIRNAYYFKSRVFVIKRMVRMISDGWAKLTVANPESAPWLQEIRDTTDDLMFYCEDLIETTHHLMNMYLSLQSHKTNEVMRILTVFSVIFMPLNLIAGIYGMNFEFIPELKNPYGYPFTLALMALIAAAMSYWIVKRGWFSMKSNPGEN